MRINELQDPVKYVCEEIDKSIMTHENGEYISKVLVKKTNRYSKDYEDNSDWSLFSHFTIELIPQAGYVFDTIYGVNNFWLIQIQMDYPVEEVNKSVSTILDSLSRNKHTKLTVL